MSANELALLRLGYRNACDERDAMAQRCRALEQCMSDPLNKLVRERDTLRAEVEKLDRIVRHLARAYIVSDDAYDPEAATDRVMARLKEQIK